MRTLSTPGSNVPARGRLSSGVSCFEAANAAVRNAAKDVSPLVVCSHPGVTVGVHAELMIVVLSTTHKTPGLTVQLRVLSMLAVAVSVGFGTASVRFRQQADTAPTTVVSGSDRLWTSGVGLKVIVRDVDQPDASISDARVVVERASTQSGRPAFATSDGAGATIVAPDSGDYVVRILRIGYGQARFRVRLEVKCQQILEAYIVRAVGIQERPVTTAGKEPSEYRAMIPTGARAVLTTCATPLPVGHVRLDALSHLPPPPPLRMLPQATGPRICLDCNARSIRPGEEPGFIIKDARARVLAMIPPGDTAFRRDPPYPFQLLEGDVISEIGVLPDSVLAPVLGGGFRNGLIVITLTTAGAELWERKTRSRATPP
jgi:hypothetical protein